MAVRQTKGFYKSLHEATTADLLWRPGSGSERSRRTKGNAGVFAADRLLAMKSDKVLLKFYSFEMFFRFKSDFSSSAARKEMKTSDFFFRVEEVSA